MKYESNQPVLEFIFALVEKKPFEGARLVQRIKVGRVLCKSSAQLCVHGRVLRFIESFLEDLRKNEKEKLEKMRTKDRANFSDENRA